MICLVDVINLFPEVMIFLNYKSGKVSPLSIVCKEPSIEVSFQGMLVHFPPESFLPKDRSFNK